MKQILIFLTFLLFTACGQPAYGDDNKTEFYPDYRTSDVRFIWHHCHQGLMKRGKPARAAYLGDLRLFYGHFAQQRAA